MIESDKLMMAAKYNDVTTVELLLKYGANIDAQDIEHNTPLYVAAWNGYTETAELLLKYAANLEAEDGEYDMFSSLCL